jgi:peptidoglycan/xylan/chitin deacetylase (PgdA/CDA1 family)
LDKWTFQPECINHIIFRDDDICVDTKVSQLRKLTKLFNEYGIDEMYSVIPYGGLEHNKGKLEDNEELVNFLRKKIKIGHNICLHGFKHKKLVETNIEAIRDAKAYLEKLLNCRIFYFAPPFNYIEPNLKDKINKLDMEVLSEEGNALEQNVVENRPINTYFCFYHYWSFFTNLELMEQFKLWLNKYYKKLKEYSQ